MKIFPPIFDKGRKINALEKFFGFFQRGRNFQHFLDGHRVFSETAVKTSRSGHRTADAIREPELGVRRFKVSESEINRANVESLRNESRWGIGQNSRYSPIRRSRNILQ